MMVNEIFKSIQGESTYAGLPCVFIRLSGCNLKCSYCDTKYAFEEGREMSAEEILRCVKEKGQKLVEITGGEPLLQEDVYKLAKRLLDENFEVLVETNGSIGIEKLDKRAIRIIDIKCPDSKMSDKMNWENLNRLNSKDEVKFVLSSRSDYEWAKEIIKKYSLGDRVKVLISCAFGKLEPGDAAGWILDDKLNVRFQMQLQKYIWKSGQRST